MGQTVTVSLIHGQRVRMSKEDEYTVYDPGLQEMPVEHARAMGMLHRIVAVSQGETEGEVTVTKLPFNGVFDEKLTQMLLDGGYDDLASLKKASRDQLLAIKGIGPSAYEQITNALKGGS